MELKEFKEVKVPVEYLPDEKFALLDIGAKSTYLVSTMGRIYSEYFNRLLEFPENNKTWVFRFVPSIPENAKKKDTISMTVQRVIATTFLPKPKGARIVIHKNFKKQDNRVENLVWSSGKFLFNEEGQAAFKAMRQKGKKLNEKDVLEMKKLLVAKRDGACSTTIKDISHKFNISAAQVYKIQSGDLWSHVGEAVKEKALRKRLSLEDIAAVKIAVKNGEPRRSIARRLGIAPITIQRIRKTI